MANYLLSYHGGAAPASEEEGVQIMAAWTKWIDSVGSSMVDAGNPTSTEAKTVAADGSVSDNGGSNPVMGYSVISADDFDAAVAIAKGCPQLASGGSIEVSEIMAVM